MEWYFHLDPPLFCYPIEAISWGISRFAKDGLANISSQGSYPDFLNYVGFIKISQDILRSTVIPFPGEKESRSKKQLFSNVKFLSIIDPNKVKSSSYNKSKIYS
jgi:hypothetical protein